MGRLPSDMGMVHEEQPSADEDGWNRSRPLPNPHAMDDSAISPPITPPSQTATAPGVYRHGWSLSRIKALADHTVALGSQYGPGPKRRQTAPKASRNNPTGGRRDCMEGARSLSGQETVPGSGQLNILTDPRGPWSGAR